MLFVGSGDGYVYNLEAKTGKTIWRFRAAPAERKIPVYGQICSTWPAASGVLVEKAVAYFAAGMVNYDGTYVYALDAKTGKIIWQNNSSGHLDKKAQCGVNVHGHLLLNNDKLYMAGGTTVSPAVYRLTDGKCLSDPNVLKQGFDLKNWTVSPRGSELYLIADKVFACGKPFYAHPQHDVYDSTVFHKTFVTKVGDKRIVLAKFWKDGWTYHQNLLCLADGPELNEKLLKSWGKDTIADTKPIWSVNKTISTERSYAIAVCRNAVVLAQKSRLLAIDINDGSVLWSQPLAAAPLPWAMAIDSQGRIIIILENSQILCFGKKTLA